MISFQKVYIVSVLLGKVGIVIGKTGIQLGGDFRGLYPIINLQIPGVLAFFATVDQPDIDPIAICIDAKATGIDKFLPFSATTAAVKHVQCIIHRWLHSVLFCVQCVECFSLTGNTPLPMP